MRATGNGAKTTHQRCAVCLIRTGAALSGLLARRSQLLHKPTFPAGGVIFVDDALRNRSIQLTGGVLNRFFCGSDITRLNRLSGALGIGAGAGSYRLIPLTAFLILSVPFLG